MADDGLQFDKAEFEAPQGASADAQRAASGPACAFCGRPLTTTYWAVADQVSCGDCRERWQDALTGGSGALRFARASVFGLIAGALGATLYFAIAALTGYEIGIVAIVVGAMVGWAVRRGADHRGGWAYQLLAIALTYGAIVTAYVPELAQRFEYAAQQPVDAHDLPTKEELARVEPSAAAYLFAFPFAFAVPFLAGVENFMGMIIICIGLYEAWRMNKRLEVPISGPHAVGPPPTAATDGAPPPVPTA